MDVHGSVNEEKRILIIKLRYIGDTVLSTPLVQVLKRGVPGSRIDVLVYDDSQEVLMGNPFVSRIWSLNHAMARKSLWYSLALMSRLRKQRYHTVVDLTNNDRSSLFTFSTGASMRIGFISGRWLRNRICYTTVIDSVLGQGHAVDHHLKVAELLGLSVEDRHPHIQVSVEAKKRMEAKLIDMGFDWNQPFVLIYPGARRWYKRWPPEQFAALADRVAQHLQVPGVFCGGEEDVAISESIRGQMVSKAFDVTGRLSLSEFAALLEHAACLVGNDAAPIHIATAVKTPTISLFGPTDWKVWAPRRKLDRVIAAEFHCMPCGHSKPDCHLGGNYCMSTISLQAVADAVAEIVRKVRKENR
jgi:predicted lipopolysaccharide heptosyltransferase III